MVPTNFTQLNRVSDQTLGQPINILELHLTGAFHSAVVTSAQFIRYMCGCVAGNKGECK